MTSALRARLTGLLPADPTQRSFALATLANTAGNGMFYAVSAIYFTQSVGLSPAQVGIGLTIAGMCGLVAGIPAGHLGDIRGPRNVLVGLALAEGAGVAAYTLATASWLSCSSRRWSPRSTDRRTPCAAG